ncbi:MAG TPA: FUN14 domain-containing protein [Limnochordia bacterium]|nr:FUN14 domain-containing protein [Limnochordia bacterium]
MNGLDGSINWPFLGGQIGLGFIFGFAMGFTLRKAIKVALIVLALLLAIGLGLQYEHIITIHWDVLQNWYDTTLQHDGGPGHWFNDWSRRLAAMIPLTGSFIAGLLLGVRKG